MLNKLKNSVLDSQIKKSIFRVGIPNTDRKRVLIVLGNVFLALAPHESAHERRETALYMVRWRPEFLPFFWFSR